MNDKLKNVVDEHRSSFDIYNTDFNQLWPEIEKGIVTRQKSIEIEWIWRVAAAFVIGIGLTLMINSLSQTSADGDELAYQISPEWQETEQYYSLRISEKNGCDQVK